MKKALAILIFSALLGVVFLAGSRSLEAYTFWCARWSPPDANFRTNPNFRDSQAGTVQDQILAMATGAYAWNNEGASLFDFHYAGTTTITYVSNDGIISMFSVNQNGFGVLAETCCQQSGGFFNGFDIKFYDGDVTWSGPGTPGFLQTDLWSVTAHELGHGLGLGHSSISAATMYPYYNLGSIAWRDLYSDDINGVRARYSGQPDVAVRILPDDPRASYGPSGGSWNFDANAENTTGSSRTVDIWFDVRLPGGGSYGPVLGPFTVSFAPGQIRSASNLSLNVPPSAPVGIYIVRMKVGTYPSVVDDESDVGLQKTTTSRSIGDSPNVEALIIDHSENLF